jgi:hypothetical protein
MFTPEELRQAKIFACLDEAECTRLAQTVADVRLEPGEWVFREGAPALFYVLLEGSLRIVLDVHGKQTEFPEHEFKRGDFLGEVPLLMGTPMFGSLRAQTSCRIARLDKQQFHRLIRDSKEARTLILETLGERLLLIALLWEASWHGVQEVPCPYRSDHLEYRSGGTSTAASKERRGGTPRVCPRECQRRSHVQTSLLIITASGPFKAGFGLRE